MKGNSPLHGLGLAQLLGMLAASQRPPSETQEELERLINADFQPIDEEDKKLWASGLEKLNRLDPNDIAGVFVNVLFREPNGKPCGGCGEVHGRPNGSTADGLAQRTIAIGEAGQLMDSIAVAVEELANRAAGPDIQIMTMDEGGNIRPL